MTPLAWGHKVAPAFRDRVRAIAAGLGCDPNWLMACMAFESAGTFRADVKNGAGSGAVGLIQFMPQTAGLLLTTTSKLVLSAVDQLDYVDAYFRPWRGKMHNLGEVYMLILWPDGVGKPDSYVLFNEGDAHPTRYLQNRGLDVDHSRRITRGELCAAVEAKLKAGLLPANAA